MAGSQKFRLRLAPLLAQQVQACAEQWDLPLARVLRLAVEDLMQHPDRMLALMAVPYGSRVDGSTPEQRAASEDYLASLQPQDLDALFGNQPRPLPY